MLEYNEIKPKKFIIFEGDPYEVLSSHVFRKQQRKPVNQTKMRHLITKKVLEHSFQVSEKVAEADLQKKDVKYLFSKPNRQQGINEYWFSSIDDPSNRFALTEELIGDQRKFMKPNTTVEALLFNDEIISIKLPIKIVLEVVEAPPSNKGDTATGGSKSVKLETGAMITTPLFVNAGEKIVINTETGEYSERFKE